MFQTVEKQSLNVTIDTMNKLTKNTNNTHSTKSLMGQNNTPQTTTFKDRVDIDLTDNWFFRYPYIRLGGEDYRKQYGDEFLKKVGIFGKVLMADAIYNYFESTSSNIDDLEDKVTDYFMLRSMFEEKRAFQRKRILNPNFLAQIKGYLYNFEEMPEHMYVWNHSIKALREYGVINEVLNLKQ